MTDADIVLDRLVAGGEWRPDWDDVLRRAGSMQTPRPLTPQWKLLIAIAVAALTVLAPLVAVAASNNWWFFAHGEAPPPTHAPVIVKSGTWNGYPWELIAYPSTTDGLCFGVTAKATAATGLGGAMGCAPFAAVSRTQATKQSPDMSITFLASAGGPLPSYIVGPVIESAQSVAIKLADGRTLRTKTFSAPTPLQHVRFYALTGIPLPRRRGPGSIDWIAGLDGSGHVVACLAPATARRGISPLSACR